MDRGARPAKVHSVAKSRTQVKEFSMHAHMVTRSLGIPSGSDGKESDYNAGDSGLIPESGRSSGEGNGYPLQYSCLENPHGQRNLVGYSQWGCKSWTGLQ